MSAWTNGTYTRKGLALLSKLTQGNSLQIVGAYIGDRYENPETLADKTGFVARQELSFQSASYPEVGTCKLPMFLSNKGVTQGYTARQIGLWAMDPDEGQVLYFVAQSETGTYVPSETEMPEYSATWTFYFRYGQADDVTVNVDPSHTITADMLNEVRIIAETGVSVPNIGAVLSLKNTAELPFAKLRLLGKTTQNGTPDSYTNTRVALESAGASGSVNVRVYGKNLLAYPYEETTTTKNGLTFTDNGDGSIKVSGTATTTTFFKFSDLPNIDGKIVVQGCPANGSYSTYSLSVDKNGENIKYEYGTPVFVECSKSDTYSLSITIRKDTTINDTFRPQVCIYDSTIETDYEEYKPAQTLTVSTPNGLRGIPVSSGGNYTDEDGQQWICDEIDFARGVYVQRVKQVTYDGSESWAKSGEYSYYIRTPDALGAEPLCDILENYGKGFITGYSYIRAGETGDGTQAIIINWGTTFSPNNADMFKSLTAAYKPTVQYALATPVETPLTAEEIAAFDALHSNNPVTTITNNGDANMEADCFLAQHEAGFKRIINYVQRYLLSQ